MVDHVDDPAGRWQIGQFAQLVGLSIPQLRRYDRLRLLEPDGREAQSGYRCRDDRGGPALAGPQVVTDPLKQRRALLLSKAGALPRSGWAPASGHGMRR